MPRPKSPVPTPPHVKPEDVQKRKQGGQEPEQKNGEAARTEPPKPAPKPDDDYNPNVGG